MTAEIAIMNKDAIALAADSAVTIDTESGKKIFNTTNKLFALTKQAPVGIMVYGSASLMGVPWESIIKIYRTQNGYGNFPLLQDYVRSFIDFLASSKELFPNEQQQAHLRRMAFSTFFKIRTNLEKVVDQLLKSTGKATPADIQRTAEQVCDAYEKAMSSLPLLDHIPPGRVRKLKSHFTPVVKEVAQAVFGAIPLSPASHKSLLTIAVERWCRNTFDSSASGVVIAGFGQKDVFPSLVSMVVDGMTQGIVRYRVLGRATISHHTTASINPFAQREMVESFMEGIDPNCRMVIDAYWKKIIERYHREIIGALQNLTDKDRTALETKLKLVGQNILKEFGDHLDGYQRKAHIDPVIDAVAVLPKDLLAEVAESLVNLTSFKRRISMTSAETVGGPIDVAVISRGDGFVWIKRKHYFKPELNPRFFANILGDSHATAEEEETSSQKQGKRRTKTG